MTPTLRPYQSAAVAEVLAAWAAGTLRVVLVLPTGGGKTLTASALVQQELADPAGRVVWLAHRRELLTQAAAALRSLGCDVGIVSPVHAPDPWARVQVASLDTLLSRGQRPAASLVVADECHHMAADTYRTLLDAYPDARMLGLTATPQRGDGRPLGDLFEKLIVGATYPQLIALHQDCTDQGLVPCRVFRPKEYLGSDLAREPLDAWRDLQRMGLDGPCFAFARSIPEARAQREAFDGAGIASGIVTGMCGNSERADTLAAFRDGRIRVLWNVFVLTEGVDVPSASVCLLARGCGNAGTYLQMVGRVLRPIPGKAHAVLVDLPGVSHVHGLPTADRAYALDGRPISVVGESLKNCPQCGACVPSAENPCEMCGYLWPAVVRKRPRVWNLELAEAIEAAGGDAAAVGEEWRVREWDRLRALASGKEWSLYWAIKQFRELFGVAPDAALMARCSEAERFAEYQRLCGVQRAKGLARGFPFAVYLKTFGQRPPRAWTQIAGVG